MERRAWFAEVGPSPQEELTAKSEFIHDKLMPNVRSGWSTTASLR